MGLLGKLMFWKREEAMPDLGKGFDFGKGADMGLPQFGGSEFPGMPGAGADNMGLPEFGQSAASAQAQGRMEMPRLEEVQPSQQGYARQQPTQRYASPETASGKDLEIISLKLDSLKATLEAINERLARLERIAEGEAESRHRF